MILDYFTLWALTKGWRDKTEGGAVRAVRAGDSAVLLEIEGSYQWNGTHLFEINLEEAFPRAVCHDGSWEGAVSFRPVSGEEAFFPILQEELSGKRLWGISSIPEVGTIRLNFKAIHKQGESDFSPSYRILFIDLRPGSRNIVLTENHGIVLGSLYPAENSDLASSTPDGFIRYEDKYRIRPENPFTQSPEEILETLSSSPLPLAEAIAEAFPRFGRFTAEQVTCEARLLPELPFSGQKVLSPRNLPRAIHELSDIGDRWYQPSILYRNNEPAAFSGSSWNFLRPGFQPGGKIRKFKSADEMLETWISMHPA